MAKEAGLVVSIDLASYNVVEANLSFLNEIISEYVDIVLPMKKKPGRLPIKNPRMP